MTGRGRRPDLPSLPYSNRVLLQIHQLMYTTDSSWEKAAEWLLLLFPGYPKHRFPSHVKDALSNASKLSAGHRTEFYDAIAVDLEYVGPVCSEIGLHRKDLLDFSELTTRCVITNGLLIELSKFCQTEKLGDTHLLKLLQTCLNYEKGRIQRVYQNLNHNKSRNGNAAADYKRQRYCINERQKGRPKGTCIKPKYMPDKHVSDSQKSNDDLQISALTKLTEQQQIDTKNLEERLHDTIKKMS